jgi:hypothetical protein
MDAQAQSQALQEQFAVKIQRSTLQINILTPHLEPSLRFSSHWFRIYAIKTEPIQYSESHTSPTLTNSMVSCTISTHGYYQLKQSSLLTEKPLETQRESVNFTTSVYASPSYGHALYSAKDHLVSYD